MSHPVLLSAGLACVSMGQTDSNWNLLKKYKLLLLFSFVACRTVILDVAPINKNVM